MSEAQPRLWGLAFLALTLRWLEELVNTLSGPLLVFGLAIALVDLLRDGALTVTAPVLLFAWAISMAVGRDAQLIGALAKARAALRLRHCWTLVGYLVLGGVLAYIAWVAAQTFATEQALHIWTALAQLGLGQTTFSVALVALSGWTRYVAPARPSAKGGRRRTTRAADGRRSTGKGRTSHRLTGSPANRWRLTRLGARTQRSRHAARRRAHSPHTPAGTYPARRWR